MDLVAKEFYDYLRTQLQHRWYMEWAMFFNERLIGVPYGPALCEVRREDGCRTDGAPEGGSRLT